MKSTVLFILFSSALLAEPLKLAEIMQALEHEHPFVKSVENYAQAHTIQNEAQYSRKPLQLSAQGAYAEPDIGESDYEYSVGIEQNFVSSSVMENSLKSAQYQSDAKILRFEYQFERLRNDVRRLYHMSCLDTKVRKEFSSSAKAFELLFLKKKKAYEYGEVSKKELLQLEIELERIENELKNYRYEAELSRHSLQSKLLLNQFEGRELFCGDVYALTSEFVFEQTDISLLEQALDKEISSVQSGFNQYDAFLNDFSLSASYQNEIDTDRFVVGLSIPLSFTSSLNEGKRSAALYKKSALEHEKEAYHTQRSLEIKILRKKLKQELNDVQALTSISKRYEEELMPLVETGYRLGEDSAIEYLLSQREMWKLKKELIVNHKNYYQTLFELYSVLEIKE